MVQTFHDLLNLHLECNNLPDCGLLRLVQVSFEPVYGETTILYPGNIIILQEYNLVCVFYHSTAK